MTKRELIEAMRDAPDDAPVWLYIPDYQMPCTEALAVRCLYADGEIEISTQGTKESTRVDDRERYG